MSQAATSPMTLEQAKKVHWMRPNPKPLGELLDQGYLDRKRLEWAAAKAYNPTLRQAAQVILHAREQSAETPKQAVAPSSISPSTNGVRSRIALAEAHETRWPFQPFAGKPMGELVDTQQLTLKDLGYAIERARDARVREAAIVLMSARIEQAIAEPSPLTGNVRVVSSGKSFAIRRTYAYTLLEGMLYGFLFTTFIAVLLWNLATIENVRPQEAIDQMSANPMLIIGLVIATVILISFFRFLGYLFDLSLKWTQRKIEQHERGAEGEERTLEIIERTLDGQWTVFRNIMIPGQRGDIDMVLVGPTGLWAFEIKNWSGKYRYHGDEWQHLTTNGWKLLQQKRKPSHQARKHAGRLNEFLKADGIHKWINPALVWANSDSSLEIDNPAMPVWRLERLQDELANVWQGTAMNDDMRSRAVEKLTKLCEAEIKRQQEPV